jgi:beta-mannanase
MALAPAPLLAAPDRAQLGGSGLELGGSGLSGSGPGAMARSDRPLALGAYIPGAPSEPQLIDRFAGQIGAMPRVIMWYQEWSGQWNEFYADGAEAIRRRGAMPMITWEPWDGDVQDRQWSLAAIARGNHDRYIRRWASDVRKWGHTIYVRPMHEMNGNWYPWGMGVNGNTPARFRAAWRHIVGVANAQGAHNIRWVWCPNVAFPGSVSYASLWPGNAYVDWLCVDGYNWAETREHTPWTSARELFKPSLNRLRALSRKRIMIGETASTEQGGDKASWILNGYAAFARMQPRVRAVIWFNKAQDGADWPVNTSTRSMRAFRTIARWQAYSGVVR